MARVYGRPWQKGQSGNPHGRTPHTPAERKWLSALTIAAHRKVTLDADLKPLPVRKKGEKVEVLTLIAEVVMRLACEGNAWAVDHIANRLDGKVRESVEMATNTNVKVKYESYAEARAALLEEGIDIYRIPMLTNMRIPEGQDRS